MTTFTTLGVFLGVGLDDPLAVFGVVVVHWGVWIWNRV